MKEIRKIVTEYDAIDTTKEQVALAAVVSVEESSYRRIGARMLVRSSGHWVGGISGGCLEGDALKRAQQAIYKNKSSVVTYDTRENDENQIGVGLGCNGKIDVLFTPINSEETNNPVEQLRKIINLNQSTIQVKVIGVGHSTDFLGQSRVVNSVFRGQDFCNVPLAEYAEAIDNAKRTKQSQVISVECHNKEKLTMLIEYHRPEIKLVIVGDNYDVNSLASIAKELGWEIHLVGKKRKLSKQVYQLAKKVYEFSEIKSIPIDEHTAVVLMSHDYNWDKTALPDLLKKQPKYLGMLGPKKRMLKMEEELGVKKLEDLPFFYSPIGLDIGAESPEEIALAISAEIVAVFRNAKSGFLKFKKGPIHNRK